MLSPSFPLAGRGPGSSGSHQRAHDRLAQWPRILPDRDLQTRHRGDVAGDRRARRRDRRLRAGAGGRAARGSRLPNPPRDLPAEERRRSCAAPPTASPCGCAITTTRCTANACRAGRSPGRCSTRSSRRGSRRSAPAHGRRRRQSRSDARRAVSPAGLSSGSPSAPKARWPRRCACLTREALTKERPPPSARRVVDLWRPGSNRASARISPSSTARSSTRTPMRGRPAGCCRISTSISAKPTSRRTPRSSRAARNPRGENQSEGEGATARRAGVDEGSPADGAAEDAQDAAEAGDGEMMPGSSDDDPGRPGRPGRCRAAQRRYRGLPRLQRRLGRGRRGRSAVRRRRAVAAAPSPRPAIGASAERHRAARQPAAAQADGQADPRLGIRPRRGAARRGAPGARRRQPGPALGLQARARDRFPRHRRHAC